MIPKLTSFYKGINSKKVKYLEVQKKLNNVVIKDFTSFLGRIYFISNDGSQNTFVYQPTLSALKLKKDKDTDYVLSWKSKGVFNSKLKLLYTAFLHSIKLSDYRVGIKCRTKQLLDQNCKCLRCLDFYAWSRNPINSFKFTNSLFGATNIVKSSYKEKHVYSEFGITFDSTRPWSFHNDTARNVKEFGAYNSSSFQK